MTRFSYLCLTLSLLYSCRSSAIHPADEASYVFVNGSVITMDAEQSVADGLAVRENRIVAVGSSEEVSRYVGPETELIDAGGRVILPGLQDSNIGLSMLGWDLENVVDLGLVTTVDELIDRMRAWKDRYLNRTGGWLLAKNLDSCRVSGDVDRWTLDRISTDRLIRVADRHGSVIVNSAVFRARGIEETRPESWPDWWLQDPPDFSSEERIERTLRNIRINGRERTYRVPTGVFRGSRVHELLGNSLPPVHLEERIRTVATGAAEMLRLGVTSVIDPASERGEAMKVYQEAYDKILTAGLRISSVYEGVFQSETAAEIENRLEMIGLSNLGDSFLRWRGVSFSDIVDIDLDREGIPEKTDRSSAILARRRAQYRVALAKGWELHSYARSQLSLEATIDLYKSLMDESSSGHTSTDARWSVILSEPMATQTEVLLGELVDHDITVNCSPTSHIPISELSQAGFNGKSLSRAQECRNYITAGVRLVSGSNYPTANHDPWRGIFSLMAPKLEDSGAHEGGNKTGIIEALKTYTVNGAYSTYEERIKGSLEPGKYADLIILDLDDLSTLEKDPEVCLEMRGRLLLTMSDGLVRFRQDGF